MTRVLLKGYYGQCNTGDDALLAASAWGARQTLGERIALTAVASSLPTFPGSDRIHALYPPVRRWRGEARVRLWVEALRSRAVLFGGGSVFHAGAGLTQVETLLRLVGHGPHVAAGVSIGPLRSLAEERACARVLRRLAFLGLRDPASAELARSLAPRVASRLTFDLAPLLLVLGNGESVPPARRRGVGLALCDFERFTGGDRRRDDLRRARLAEVVRALDRDAVDELVLVDFNGDPTRGDAPIHAEMASVAREAGLPVRRIPYDPRPLEVLRTVASLRAMVAMRLHGAVFGYLARTPTLILAYHPKCRGWAEQIRAPAELVHDSVDFDPAAVARTIAVAAGGGAREPALAVESAVELARLNFPALSVQGLARPDVPGRGRMSERVG
jgi:polysaccharide pyruvyl transferase WcaK-like protein